MLDQLIRGPLLIPRGPGRVDYFADGALAADDARTIRYAGPFAPEVARGAILVRPSDGVMLPPFLDIHTHVPQHPIRGRFTEGVAGETPNGRLLEGLKRNVFPAEAKCNDESHARAVVHAFLADTLAHGVVGGAAYMTPSAVATGVALELLPREWSVGLVLMNRNCPPELCTDSGNLERDVDALAARFGRRLIVTDRFAVAVDTRLRLRGVALAKKHGLRTQTHLNEQRAEKDLVERQLYPNHAGYADVYLKDGLLDHRCILAHCIHMRDDEWSILRDAGSVIAHCPTSNLHLSSGTMDLDAVVQRGISYALATDVGASPTVSMLAEMKRFLTVHASPHATPAEALYRSTLAPAGLLGLDLGDLSPGKPLSFIEVAPAATGETRDPITSLLPGDPDAPGSAVNRVTLAGRVVFDRNRPA